jgi:energy-coupling factor transport system substrate-specific component
VSLPRAATFALAAAAMAAAAWTALAPDDAAFSLLLVALALTATAYAWLESGPGSAAELALIGALAGIAAAGRVLFAAVPGVQPVTVIAVAAGAALGARAGMAVGATAALVSNLFLGQGPWTPWQMLGWAGCGLAGALARRAIQGRLPFALLCAVLGLAFSALMDVWLWFSFYPHTWPAFAAVLARGVPFDLSHAIGNLLIALVAGPELRRLLERYGRRLRPQVVWD